MQEYSSEEILYLIRASEILKIQYKTTRYTPKVLRGKTLAMIFQKPSTRTRVSFEVAMHHLGGKAIYLNWNELQLGRGETISDTAKTISKYTNGIMARVFSHKDLELLSDYAEVPVINGLSDLWHPCQALADIFTIYEYFRTFKGIKVAYVGDGNNVCNSLLIACSKVGLDISVATPRGYEPYKLAIEYAKDNSEKTGSNIIITNDPKEAVMKANIIYTDVWISMGQEKETERRLKVFPPYQVNSELIKVASENHIIMHCLPAHRGYEITDEIIDGPRSAVWRQAENRLHTQKALLAQLIL
jgi:ornithine carbamoyltransferase